MKNIVLTFFIANALFWGLFPHNAHCLLIENINSFLKMNINCPPHHIHLLMGLFFYILSVYMTQKDTGVFTPLNI